MIEVPKTTEPLILQGDVFQMLPLIPDESIHTVITSPPYWGLRSYLPEDHPEKHLEIGSEKTFPEWLHKMVLVFREVRRVLRKDGTLWVNIGDAYVGQNFKDIGGIPQKFSCYKPTDERERFNRKVEGLRRSTLLMMPARLAIALHEDGWDLVAENIWEKPNAQPESAKRRPTRAHETVYLFAKDVRRHYFDMDAVREPQTGNAHSRGNGSNPKQGKDHLIWANIRYHKSTSKYTEIQGGRNLRTIWRICTHPSQVEHFATFPPELVMRCIAAGTSEEGCCPECGKPWARVAEREKVVAKDFTLPEGKYTGQDDRFGAKRLRINMGRYRQPGRDHHNPFPRRRTIGWKPSCKHDLEPIPCVVLDLFSGIGTTNAAATMMRRRSIGIELSEEYIAAGLPDVEAAFKGITRKEIEAGQGVLFQR